MLEDTIVAVSTTQGAGLRAIVRISGPAAWAWVRAVSDLPVNAGRGWHSLALRELPCDAAVMLFEAPRSFTGEEVAELHLSNSPALVRIVVDALLACKNVRLALPGEFSARAFFNGKMDLTEAEGIAATISSGSETQLRAAASLRQGDMHRWTAALTERVAALLATVEAGIDFTEEEDVRFIEADSLAASLTKILADVQRALAHGVRFDRLGKLPTVVFVGPPNVGKSSLVNALCERERAIISPMAGTTRDMLEAVMHTPRGDVRLLDVPGEEPPSDELREKMMAARAGALLEADLVLDVSSADAPETDARDFGAEHWPIFNKADLLTSGAPARPPAWQWVSAKTGRHIAALREAIGEKVYATGSISPEIPAVNQRHRAILRDAAESLQTALQAGPSLAAHPELVASELRRALDLLGQITGVISPDEVLGKIFSQFCIGK